MNIERKLPMPHTRTSRDQWQESGKRKEYQQPEGVVARSIWRLWMKTKTTFALSMLEPWEIILIFAITGIVTLLVTVGLVRYFPHAIVAASRRAHYYLSGSDSLVDLTDSLKTETWTGGRVDL